MYYNDDCLNKETKLKELKIYLKKAMEKETEAYTNVHGGSNEMQKNATTNAMSLQDLIISVIGKVKLMLV